MVTGLMLQGSRVLCSTRDAPDEMHETDMEEAGEALAGGLSNISVIAPPAAAEATAAAADASAEETADLAAGRTSQGTSALEAQGKGEIKSQALQGAEDKAKLVSEPAGASVVETAAAETAAKKVEPVISPNLSTNPLEIDLTSRSPI